MKSLSGRNSVIVAATLFSMFFGAGNLILPPLVGAYAGGASLVAGAGFMISSIGLPILGVVASALSGSLADLASRVSEKFSYLYVMLIYLTIGPFLAIPRTSSTSFEMLVPLLPEGTDVMMVSICFSVVFFTVAFILALHPNKLVDILGKVSAPALIVLIVVLVGAAVLMPSASALPVRAPYGSDAAIHGFVAGYQTMDLLAALNFGLVIAMNIRELGVTDSRDVAREIVRSGVLAGLLMAAIYMGLTYVGATTAQLAPEATNGALLLVVSAQDHFGVMGNVLVAAIFLIACLNVCISLISCCSEYFSETFPKVSYRRWAIMFTVFSCVVSNVGLSKIIAFSVPLLSCLYPISIVLVLLGLISKQVDKYPAIWKTSVLTAVFFGVVCSVRATFSPHTVLPIIDSLPGAEFDLSWVVPVFLSIVVGWIISCVQQHKAAGTVK